MSPSKSNLEAKFTFETDTPAVSEDSPFHILVLGNWSGNRDKDSEPEKKRPLMIDRDNFDDIFRKIKPGLQLSFDNSSLLNLNFTELDDFHPDNLFRQIPLFSELRDLRKKLKNPDTFNDAAAEIRSWFSESIKQADEPQNEIPVETDSESLLDEILSGSPASSSTYKRRVSESTELSNLINDIVKPHLIRIDLEEQSNLLSALDEVVSDLMRKILHHKDFQDLEAAWRGLYFLVRKSDTDNDLKIFMLDLSKEELESNLKASDNLAESIFYQWTAGEILETSIGEKWALCCGIYEFDANVNDTATLMRLAKISNAAHTPFIAAISPRILGVESLVDKPFAGEWQLSANSPEFKLWSALRSTEEAKFLGLAMPRFLIRLPYGRNTDPAEAFSFEEFTDIPHHDEYLWTNPAFACASLLAQSFRRYGWELAENIAREINGLPMHVYQDDNETKTKPCAEIAMTELSVQKMIDAGVMPFVSFRDTDKIRIASFQSISLSGERLQGRWY